MVVLLFGNHMQRSLTQNDSLQRRAWPRSLLMLELNGQAQRLQVHDERLQVLFCQLTRERWHDGQIASRKYDSSTIATPRFGF
jgi:hypothetical protein